MRWREQRWAVAAYDSGTQVLRQVLRNNGWEPFFGFFDLAHEPVPPNVPKAPGVYTILVDDGTLERYPNGRSKIIYIGESHGAGGLQSRLKTHKRGIRQAGAAAGLNGDERFYGPLYEFAAAFGALCLYTPAPAGASSEGMEAVLLADFEFRFWTLPRANRQHETVRS